MSQLTYYININMLQLQLHVTKDLPDSRQGVHLKL